MGCFSRRGSFVVTLIVTVALACCEVFGAPVDLAQVQNVTHVFLRMHVGQSAGRTGMRAAASQTAPAPRGYREIRDRSGTVVAYVADLDPRGFVAIAANTEVAPVVAYSLRSSFPPVEEAEHPLTRILRADLALRAQALAENPQLQDPMVARLWNLYLTGAAEDLDEEAFQQWPAEGTTSTGGWLETTWEQETPYNNFCPLDPVDGQRSYVGCAATAMAQIMHHHQQFNMSFGPDDSYTTYSGLCIDADSDLYDFPSFAQLNGYLDTVKLKYREGRVLDETDMAALSFACGVALQMDYSSEGSGAPISAMRDALLDKLGLHSADLFGGISRASHLILQENILNGLPALVSIGPPDGFGGHAIVCDGYNTRGEYHLNFGWGRPYPTEIAEAWYYLPADMPSRASVIKETILNLQPDEPLITVDSDTMDFYGVPGQASASQTVRISNLRANTLIDSISSPDGFVISREDDVYTDRIDSFTVESPDAATSVYVKFHPEQARGYYGTLKIGYNNGNSFYVVLRGWAFEGGTSVPAGSVSGAWTESQGPYFVTGDIRVPQSRALEIQPGVKVFFMGHYGLTVGPGARVVARGNAARPIELTAWNREDGWAGLRFIESDDDDVLSHCLITFVRKGADPIPQESGASDSEDTTPDSRGGAVYCSDSSPTIHNCIIANNTGDVAGAFYCYAGDPVITNTVIANNTSLGDSPRCGGLCFDGPGSPQVINCTIVNNFPGGIFTTSWLSPTVVNTLVWGNDYYQIQTNESIVDVTFSDVQGGYPGEGNMDLNPCFLDPTSGAGVEYDGGSADWALCDFSPCVNAGTHVNRLAETDPAGGPRICCDIIDIGAYESQAEGPVLTVLPSVTLDAGFVGVDASTMAHFDLLNTGQAGLTVQTLSLSDANEVFSMQTMAEGRYLSPGDSLRVEVEFRPTTERVYTGVVDIRSDGPRALHQRVALRGVGVSGTIIPGGPVSGTWPKADGPYTVTGDIEVPRDQTLTIEPGVVVRFAGRFRFTVGYRATLSAIGTEQDKITFTATDTDKGWYGIRFYSSGTDDTLQHCILEYAKKPRESGTDVPDLFGGAIFCGTFGREWGARFTYASPLIDSCLFRDNYARTGGAIACLDGSEATITNNTFIDNSADYDGGAITMYVAYCTIRNNVIARNAALVGGGIMNYLSAPAIVNNTLVSNRPSAMHLEVTTASSLIWEQCSIANNIVWNNEIFRAEYVLPEEYDIRFNDIQGGWSGQNNIDVDPIFADPAHDDYHLQSEAGRWDPATRMWKRDQSTSPCIDAGNTSTGVEDEPLPNGGRINLGAYGGTAQASKTH